MKPQRLEFFCYKDKSIPVEIIRSQRKTIALAVAATAKIVVRIPLQVPLAEVAVILQEKERWLYAKLAYWESCKEQKRIFEVAHGRSILFQGKFYSLKIAYEPAKPIGVRLERNQLLVNTEDATEVNSLLKGWYYEQTSVMLKQGLQKAQAMFALRPRVLRVKEQKKRWGSCTYDNKLLFNWRLAMAPQFVVEYVLLHEMCHMLVKNHSVLFWAEVAKRCPSYKVAKQWLKENGVNMQIPS
ncbi:MAG TPA: M48 family metallopeptidase [Candidatus Avacidaminococcus intestinavium]|uniref:M48 family metallopeptidase n=1 Tax=Candidatus Avacidaminococcus intestinavium TaxID=2840684 RepID=A0A9D1MR37_9FIRM|nr:M48 family metallopeptidase [Candidatus Avacidaminococcus intestinavium]